MLRIDSTVDRPMNRTILDTYVETQLVPTLDRGDVVVLDNLPVHESAKAATFLKEAGAWFLFLPGYSPDLNLSKLKTLLRKKVARSFEAISNALGDICALFTVEECRNYFKAAGYEAN